MPKALPVIDTTAPVCCAPVAAGPMNDEDARESRGDKRGAVEGEKKEMEGVVWCVILWCGVGPDLRSSGSTTPCTSPCD